MSSSHLIIVVMAMEKWLLSEYHTSQHATQAPHIQTVIIHLYKTRRTIQFLMDSADRTPKTHRFPLPPEMQTWPYYTRNKYVTASSLSEHCSTQGEQFTQHWLLSQRLHFHSSLHNQAWLRKEINQHLYSNIHDESSALQVPRWLPGFTWWLYIHCSLHVF